MAQIQTFDSSDYLVDFINGELAFWMGKLKNHPAWVESDAYAGLAAYLTYREAREHEIYLAGQHWPSVPVMMTTLADSQYTQHIAKLAGLIFQQDYDSGIRWHNFLMSRKLPGIKINSAHTPDSILTGLLLADAIVTGLDSMANPREAIPDINTYVRDLRATITIKVGESHTDWNAL